MLRATWIDAQGWLYHPVMHGKWTALYALVAALVLSMSSQTANSRSLPESLPDCPDRPNCVSSQASDAAHAVAPFAYSGNVQDAMRRLKSALAAEPRITLVAEGETYLHAEARSLIFRFVDDLEFLIDPERSVIDVRSAARVGYSDLGVNRRRVERLRRAFSR